MGGGGGDESPAAPAASPAPAAAASAPATTPAAAAPAPVARPAVIEPVKPDPPYLAAAKTRKKIPYWAMFFLALLPLWAFMYVRSLQDQSVAVEGPRAAGEVVYGSCESCHGAEGQGGSGRQLNQGEVLKTFPAIQDQLRWIAFGTDKYKAAAVEIYGNPDREGGPHITGSFGVMPGWQGPLTDAQILAATCYVRYDLGGADPNDPEYQGEYAEWCAPDAPQYAALEGGATFADPAFANVGNAPAPGRATPYPPATP